MGFLGLDFSNVEAPKAPEMKPFRPGTYLLKAAKAEVKPTKKGGKMLTIEFNIVGGTGEDWKDFDGWRVNHNFNIAHTNPQVVEISKQQINAMMIYMGLDPNAAEGASDLIGKTAFAKLGTRTYEGKDRIEIKYFVEDKTESGEESSELFN